MPITVGVDIAKLSHEAAAYDPASDRTLARLKFEVSREGFESFDAWLQQLAPNREQLIVGVEATGHYHLTLVEFLMNRGYFVVLLNPYKATQFRRSQGGRAKTDRIDAQSMARFLASNPDSQSQPTDTALMGLRELTRFRDELVHNRTMAKNRLHAALDLVFPELPKVFSDIASPTILTIIGEYPTARAFAEASPEALSEAARGISHGKVGADKIHALIEAARSSIGISSAAAAVGIKVRSLARQIASLNQELADLERAIATEFARLGYCAEHFPIGSPVALATIVAEAGDVGRYSSAKKFLAHFGWCPEDERSGKYQNVHPLMSKAGNRYVRRMIWMLAVRSVQYPGPYKEYFDRRTASGKKKMHSLVAIGRKLLATIYSILKTGRPYDPQYQIISKCEAGAWRYRQEPDIYLPQTLVPSVAS